MGGSGFAERYASATRSTNLSHSPRRITDTDVLTALAWTHPLASVMFRAKVANDPQSVRALYREWAQVCEQNADGWGITGPQAAAVSRASVNQWLDDVCPTCSGRKFALLSELRGEAMTGRDALSDQPCHTCRGTGKRVMLKGTMKFRWAVDKAVTLLVERFASYGRAASRRLQ